MLTIFNRKELITTMDMQRQANIRSVLFANGIAYTVRTENLQGSSAFGGGVFPAPCRGTIKGDILFPRKENIPL